MKTKVREYRRYRNVVYHAFAREVTSGNNKTWKVRFKQSLYRNFILIAHISSYFHTLYS
jgi:hypothetical protein